MSSFTFPLSSPLTLNNAQFYGSHFAQALSAESAVFTLADADNETVTLTPVDTKEASSAQLVVSCEALNIEKIYQVETALKGLLNVAFWQLSKSRTAATFSGSEEASALTENSGKRVAKAKVTVREEMADFRAINAVLEKVAQALQVEIAYLHNAPVLAEPGLLVMDMDSTVINIECIDEIAKLAGVGDKVSEVTELAMQGKLDFAQSLTSRVACLENAEEAILKTVRDKVPLMPGIENLVATLKQQGWKIAIASGGFTYFANYLKQRLGLDYAISNELEIIDAKLTGKVLGNIVDAQVKAQTVVSLAQQFAIPMSQTVALGDGANDLVMMEQAGLGVAYKAKPIVREQAQTSIRFGALDQMLDYLR